MWRQDTNFSHAIKQRQIKQTPTPNLKKQKTELAPALFFQQKYFYKNINLLVILA